MSDFFERQEKTRKQTGFLIFLVAVAVMGVIAAHYAVVCLFEVLCSPIGSGGIAAFWTSYLSAFSSGRYLWWTAGGTLLVILVGSFLRIRSLAGDGISVAKAMKAREIEASTRSPEEKRLLNVIEEMAITAGIRIPHLFLLDHEVGLNAFSAGNSTDSASIIVTHGLLDKLTREELQAVVGHEFSHILNGDMRQNIKLIGLSAGIFDLVAIGLFLIKPIPFLLDRDLEKGKTPHAIRIVMAILLLAGAIPLISVGSIGYFFGRIVQSAISLRREYQADDGATRFTRDPMALASALKSIGAERRGGLLTVNSLEIAHMCFVSPRRVLFATHPSLLKRIRRLDPSFDGDFTPCGKGLRNAGGLPGARGEDRSPAMGDTRRLMEKTTIRGALLADLIACDLTTEIYDALHQPQSAMAFLLAVTFADTDGSLADRMEGIALRSPFSDYAKNAPCGPGTMLDQWCGASSEWSPALRRAGCELATATLRPLSPVTREGIYRAVVGISALDHHRTPFELLLTALIGRRLRDDRQGPIEAFVRPDRLRHEASIVMSVLCAYAGDRTLRDSAWSAAVGVYTPLAKDSPCTDGLRQVEVLDEAMTALRRLPYSSKDLFMSACQTAIAADGRIGQDEENLLLAIEDGIRA